MVYPFHALAGSYKVTPVGYIVGCPIFSPTPQTARYRILALGLFAGSRRLLAGLVKFKF
jgi:hypothetical protein